MAIWADWARSQFPQLASDPLFEMTSDATWAYNCIAWAAGDIKRFWWPEHDGYWPPGVDRVVEVSAFVSAFATLGYRPCRSADLEAAVEKIALFTRAGAPTHAARQLGDGSWTSKLGRGVDISHSLEAVEGTAYGVVSCILARAREDGSE